jgi:hypothetical protein
MRIRLNLIQTFYQSLFSGCSVLSRLDLFDDVSDSLHFFVSIFAPNVKIEKATGEEADCGDPLKPALV